MLANWCALLDAVLQDEALQRLTRDAEDAVSRFAESFALPDVD